jgi:hypothetical protein
VQTTSSSNFLVAELCPRRVCWFGSCERTAAANAAALIWEWHADFVEKDLDSTPALPIEKWSIINWFLSTFPTTQMLTSANN